MKIAHITHSDLDGFGCSVLVGMVHPQRKTFFCGYNDIDRTVEKCMEDYDEIILTDIVPGKKVLTELLLFKGAKVTIIDHHKRSALKALENLWEHATVVYDDSMSGTALVFQHWFPSFLELKGKYPHLPEWVMAVNARDLWLREDADLWLVGDGLDRLRAFFGRKYFLNREPTPLLTSEESLVVANLVRQERGYIRAKMHRATLGVDENGDTFAWVIASRHTSQLGHQLANEAGANYGAVYLPEFGKVELRSNGFDVGALALQRGGGGHERASGYLVDEVRFEDIIPKNAPRDTE